MMRGCLMFVFTLVFVSIFSLVAGFMAFTKLGRSEVVSMPSLIGMPQQEAVDAINEAGLIVENTPPKEDYDHPPGTVIRQHPAPFTQVKLKRGVTIYISTVGRVTQVPEIRGLEESNIPLQLGKAKLALDTVSRTYHSQVESGKVIATFPPAGAEVPEDSGVDILVSRGPAPKAYVMPELAYLPESEVRDMLDKVGISIVRERRAVRTEYGVGKVIDQSPAPGKKVSTRDTVKLFIGFLEN